MNEQLAQKVIEALTTAAHVATGEAPKLMAEFINYMLFSAIFSCIQSLTFGLIAVFVYKVGNLFVEFYKVEHKNHIESNNKRKGMSLQDRKTYSDNLYNDKLSQQSDVDNALSTLHAARFFNWVTTIIVILVVLSCSIENFQKLGKVLIAPRLVVLESSLQFYKEHKK